MKTMYMDVSKALATITTIATRSAKLDKDIQAVAESAIYHSNMIGDQNCDIGLKLVAALGKGQKSASLKVYLATHGQFGLKDPDDNKSFGFVENKERQFKKDDVVRAAQLLAVLQANAWHDAVKEPNISNILDAGKEVARLVKRIQEAVKSGKEITWGTNKVAELVKAVVVDGCEINLAE